jgi:hypothetical protein
MSPDAATLLAAWEAGAGQPPARQALLLLQAAGAEDAGAWPAGTRDLALLRLREALFGPDITALADCPRCGAAVEIACATADFAAGPPPQQAPFEVTLGPYRALLRLPSAQDLAGAAAAGDVAGAAALLLARCVLSAEAAGEPVAPASLPPPVIAAIGEAVAARDPMAEPVLALACPDCGAGWEIGFDAGAFLWAELDAWAGRTLDEVHVLASAYGWTEAEVLRLLPRRRQAYRERIAACLTP